MRYLTATASLLLFLSPVVSLALAADSNSLDHVLPSSSSTVLRWASSGGGWRAMGAAMGFAQAFYKAGTLGGEITAISTTSGSSWFSTQFGYSEKFYEQIVSGDLYDFVLDWMKAYQNYTQEIYTEHPICTYLNGTETFCNLLLSLDGSWATFVDGMLQAASTAYGDDGLTTRQVNAENRVTDLQETDLYIQMGLAANSRTSSGEISYLKPKNGLSSPSVYTVPIPVQHAVTSESSYFTYAVEPESLPLYTAVASAPKSFSFNSWEDLFLYPVSQGSGSILTSPKQSPVTSDNGPLNEPFSGTPTVAQLAASSSAAAGFLNGDVPSLFAQVESMKRNAILTSNATAIEKQKELAKLTLELNMIYKHQVFDDFSVCSQWPVSSCGESDGRFVDGGYVDMTGLAQNVGQYQSSSGANLNATLKLIVTNMNSNGEDQAAPMLTYFAKSDENVAPGDFVWPGSNPRRSNQVFAESFDNKETFDSHFAPIDGTTLTYAVFQTTTVSNPAFGIQEGQMADVLIININSEVPVMIIGSESIAEWSEPLAETAQDIAQSQHLVTVVEDFLAL